MKLSRPCLAVLSCLVLGKTTLLDAVAVRAWDSGAGFDATSEAA